MRVRFPWLAALVLALLWRLSPDGFLQLRWRGLLDRFRASPLGEDSINSQTYVLPQKDWLTFGIPASARMLRVLSNANLPKDAREWDQELEYVFDYELLGGQNETLAQGQYHCRTQLVPYVDPESGQSYMPSAFVDDSIIPAATQRMLYNLTKHGGEAQRLRLRLSSKHPSIRDVSIRVYSLQEVPEHHLARLWQRTTQRRKERMCRTSVYTPDLLSETERVNLLRSQWSALPPKGMEGIDFQRRVIFALEEVAGAEATSIEYPAGLLIHSKRHGIIPLPHESGTVRLEFAAAEQTGLDQPVALETRWYGRDMFDRAVYHSAILKDDPVVSYAVEGGLLELVTATPLAVRAHWARRETPDELAEITPPPNYLRAFYMDETQDLVYAITHVRGGATPFRVSVRRLWTEHDQTPAQLATISWQLLDRHDNVLKSGTLTADLPESFLEAVDGIPFEYHMSESSDAFFNLDATVARVRFCSASCPVLLSAFTRPNDLVKTIRIPDDYDPYYREEAQPSWYRLHPMGYRDLVEACRTWTLDIQPAPRDVDADLLAGRYDWQDYVPAGAWHGRHLLAPRDPRTPARSNAAANIYSELTANVEYELSFLARLGRTVADPRLLQVAGKQAPGTLRLFVDGQLHGTFHASRNLIEIPLAPLDTREARRVKIESSADSRLFLSNLELDENSQLIKRFAIQLQGAAETFLYRKETWDEEALALHVFQTPACTNGVRLLVSIHFPTPRLPGPSREWTLSQRQFDLRPLKSFPTVVLGTNGGHADVGQACIIRLGSDVGPGDYQIDIQASSDAAVYVILSKSTPGDFDMRESFLENAE